jgi:predicted short-subunit dehydrogenase-like oxidoreductase (DUF2520 family)
MARSFKLSIIGAGNLASNLVPELENAGHIINTVSSLHIESAQNLAGSLYNTHAVDHTDLSSDDSEIILLAVRDDVIEYLVPEITAPAGAILAHCSGFAPLDALNAYDGPTGVFYPLQSFTKGQRKSFESIPICVESYDEKVADGLKELGKTISKNVAFVSSQERRKMHVAAVFANNFVNRLLAISESILADTKLDLSLLKPLVLETVDKAFRLGPEKAQTGPAKRGDMNTIQAHLEMLESNPEIAELYELLTRQIMDSAD